MPRVHDLDPGAERGLRNMPRAHDPDAITEAVDHHGAHPEFRVSTDLEALLFPLAVLVTGPLHIVWNAFQTALNLVDWWPELKELISAVLSFLGHSGIGWRGTGDALLGPCFCRSTNWRPTAAPLPFACHSHLREAFAAWPSPLWTAYAPASPTTKRLLPVSSVACDVAPTGLAV